jgi:hypothetical protein
MSGANDTHRNESEPIGAINAPGTGSSSAARSTAVVSHHHAQGRCGASVAGLFPATPCPFERFHGLLKSFVVLVIEPADLQR